MKVRKLFLLLMIGMLMGSVCFFGCDRKESVIRADSTTRIEKTIGTTKIILLEGVDIVTIDEVDAIVNAANEGLAAGGGVCGAIHKAAGPGLAAECNSIPGSPKCPTGRAVITGSYNLAARGIRYVVHAVGPRIVGAVTLKDQANLASAYRKSLSVASTRGVRRIAFPCISTAIFGYPGDQAASIAFKAVTDYITANSGRYDKIIFTCYDPKGMSKDYDYYKKLFDALP